MNQYILDDYAKTRNHKLNKGGNVKKNDSVPLFRVERKEPKILVFDIETAPNLVYTWGMWDQNVIAVKQDWYILSFVAKWLGSKDVIAKGLCDYKGYAQDKSNDKLLVEDLWKLFDSADLILGHNGDEFDIKKCNTRFLIHGLTPPTPFKSVDTKKVAKKHFRFDSNKMDELGRQLGIGRKKEHEGFALWLACMAGDRAAWKRMLAYNVQDVLLLERLYLRMRPYMTTHPNMNLLRGTTHSCPNCGSSNCQRRGHSITKTQLVQRYQCKSCGAWSQGLSEKTDKKVIIR